jgi:hypothetical protein
MNLISDIKEGTQTGCLRTGCWGGYLDRREMKWWEGGENCITRSFVKTPRYLERYYDSLNVVTFIGIIYSRVHSMSGGMHSETVFHCFGSSPLCQTLCIKVNCLLPVVEQKGNLFSTAGTLRSTPTTLLLHFIIFIAWQYTITYYMGYTVWGSMALTVKVTLPEHGSIVWYDSSKCWSYIPTCMVSPPKDSSLPTRWTCMCNFYITVIIICCLHIFICMEKVVSTLFWFMNTVWSEHYNITLVTYIQSII